MSKKKTLICQDDNGNDIFHGDTVEVLIPWETSTSHQSAVYFNPLDGAFIDSHPAHIKMKMGSNHRRLRDYLNQSEGKGLPIYEHPDDEEPKEWRKGFCKKVNNV